MASVLKVDKLDPQSGTALEIGTSGDTISLPSGATLDISASTLTPPATMPASSGINFTALNATNLGSGTVPDARFPATLPAASGVNLTSLDAANLGSNKVPTARLGSGTASSSTILYGDQTYKAEPSGGVNAPYFRATLSTTQTMTPLTVTFPVLDNEILDSDGDFSTSTYRFTPSVAGKYFVQWASYIYSITNTDTIDRFDADLLFNGSTISGNYFRIDNAYRSYWGTANIIVDCNGSSDYFTFQSYCDTTSGNVTIGALTSAQGFRLLT